MPKSRKVWPRTEERSVSKNCYRIEKDDIEHRRQGARIAILTTFKFFF